jgi:hypothetical protein
MATKIPPSGKMLSPAPVSKANGGSPLAGQLAQVARPIQGANMPASLMPNPGAAQPYGGRSGGSFGGPLGFPTSTAGAPSMGSPAVGPPPSSMAAQPPPRPPMPVPVTLPPPNLARPPIPAPQMAARPMAPPPPMPPAPGRVPAPLPPPAAPAAMGARAPLPPPIAPPAMAARPGAPAPMPPPMPPGLGQPPILSPLQAGNVRGAAPPGQYTAANLAPMLARLFGRG